MKLPETIRLRASTLATSAAAALALTSIVGTVPSALADDWKAVRFGQVSLQVPTWCQMAASDEISADCSRFNETGMEFIMVLTSRDTVPRGQFDLDAFVQARAAGMERGTANDTYSSRRLVRIPANALPRGAQSCVRGEFASTNARQGTAKQERAMTCGALSPDGTSVYALHTVFLTEYRAGTPLPFPDFENRATRVLRSATFRDIN
jgi:hypothetical protein